MSLLHGDQITSLALDFAVAIFESHDDSTPFTTLTKGWACDLYSFCTMDSFGVNTSAE